MTSLPLLINHIFLIHFINIHFHCVRYNRSTFYQPSFHVPDFVCSTPEGPGTSKCSDIEPYYRNGIECNGSLENNSVVNNSVCVNWNQYYINCTPNGPNPFYDTTSFDNIGIAWIAIFQVRKLFSNWQNSKYLKSISSQKIYSWNGNFHFNRLLLWKGGQISCILSRMPIAIGT